MRRLAAFGTALVLMNAPLAAQSTSSADSLLEHLVGSWVLQGTIAGQEVTHDVTAAWVLGHGYVELRELSRERTAAGGPAYEAIVYFMWNPATRQYACLWLDNTGAGPFTPIGFGPAVPGGDSIPFVFRLSDTESIRNTFAYDRMTDSWQSRIDNEKSGTRQPFARVTLRRRH